MPAARSTCGAGVFAAIALLIACCAVGVAAGCAAPAHGQVAGTTATDAAHVVCADKWLANGFGFLGNPATTGICTDAVATPGVTLSGHHYAVINITMMAMKARDVNRRTNASCAVRVNITKVSITSQAQLIITGTNAETWHGGGRLCSVDVLVDRVTVNNGLLAFADLRLYAPHDATPPVTAVVRVTQSTVLHSDFSVFHIRMGTNKGGWMGSSRLWPGIEKIFSDSPQPPAFGADTVYVYTGFALVSTVTIAGPRAAIVIENNGFTQERTPSADRNLDAARRRDFIAAAASGGVGGRFSVTDGAWHLERFNRYTSKDHSNYGDQKSQADFLVGRLSLFTCGSPCPANDPHGILVSGRGSAYVVANATVEITATTGLQYSSYFGIFERLLEDAGKRITDRAIQSTANSSVAIAINNAQSDEDACGLCEYTYNNGVRHVDRMSVIDFHDNRIDIRSGSAIRGCYGVQVAVPDAVIANRSAALVRGLRVSLDCRTTQFYAGYIDGSPMSTSNTAMALRNASLQKFTHTFVDITGASEDEYTLALSSDCGNGVSIDASSRLTVNRLVSNKAGNPMVWHDQSLAQDVVGIRCASTNGGQTFPTNDEFLFGSTQTRFPEVTKRFYIGGEDMCITRGDRIPWGRCLAESSTLLCDSAAPEAQALYSDIERTCVCRCTATEVAAPAEALVVFSNATCRWALEPARLACPLAPLLDTVVRRNATPTETLSASLHTATASSVRSLSASQTRRSRTRPSVTATVMPPQTRSHSTSSSASRPHWSSTRTSGVFSATASRHSSFTGTLKAPPRTTTASASPSPATTTKSISHGERSATTSRGSATATRRPTKSPSVSHARSVTPSASHPRTTTVTMHLPPRPSGAPVLPVRLAEAATASAATVAIAGSASSPAAALQVARAVGVIAALDACAGTAAIRSLDDASESPASARLPFPKSLIPGLRVGPGAGQYHRGAVLAALLWMAGIGCAAVACGAIVVFVRRRNGDADAAADQSSDAPAKPTTVAGAIGEGLQLTRMPGLLVVAAAVAADGVGTAGTVLATHGAAGVVDPLLAVVCLTFVAAAAASVELAVRRGPGSRDAVLVPVEAIADERCGDAEQRGALRRLALRVARSGPGVWLLVGREAWAPRTAEAEHGGVLERLGAAFSKYRGAHVEYAAAVFAATDAAKATATSAANGHANALLSGGRRKQLSVAGTLRYRLAPAVAAVQRRFLAVDFALTALAAAFEGALLSDCEAGTAGMAAANVLAVVLAAVLRPYNVPAKNVLVVAVGGLTAAASVVAAAAIFAERSATAASGSPARADGLRSAAARLAAGAALASNVSVVLIIARAVLMRLGGVRLTPREGVMAAIGRVDAAREAEGDLRALTAIGIGDGAPADDVELSLLEHAHHRRQSEEQPQGSFDEELAGQSATTAVLATPASPPQPAELDPPEIIAAAEADASDPRALLDELLDDTNADGSAASVPVRAVDNTEQVEDAAAVAERNRATLRTLRPRRLTRTAEGEKRYRELESLLAVAPEQGQRPTTTQRRAPARPLELGGDIDDLLLPPGI